MSDTTGKTPKVSRGWRIVLVGSLALNLAIVGLVGSAFLKHGGPPRGKPGFDPLVNALDKSARKDIMGRLSESGLDRRAHMRDVREATAQMIALLRAPEFDADAFRAQFNRRVALLTQTRTAADNGILEYLEGLNADERTRLADRFEERLSKRRKHK